MSSSFEHKEQEALFEWASYAKINGKCLREYMWATENGGSRHILEAVNLKKRGVKAGVPDIFVAIPNQGWHGLFIELKRKTNYKVSEKQQEMIKLLLNQGYLAHVCLGWEDAKNKIENYLK